MSTQHFHFDEYIVRPVNEGDRAYLETLIEEDEYHRECMTADYFLNLLPGEDAWALEDEQGNVLFYFKTQTAVRVSIQFAASKSAEERRVNRTALTKGLAWIETMLRQNHFREMIFDTKGPQLAAFAKKRLGFTASFCELTRAVSPPKPIGRAVTHWGAAPHDTQKSG